MYPLETEMNSNFLCTEDDFWDSGETFKCIPDKFSSMVAPSSEIWDKLDLQTPPRSPCFLSVNEQPDLPDSMEDDADIYRLSETEDECNGLYASGNPVVVNELIHDCMWSGQCADGCKSSSLSKCTVRTRVDSFGSISNLSDVSGYTLQNGSATPMSLLGGVSIPLLSDSDDLTNVLSSPSSSSYDGPPALSDHSYSTMRRQQHFDSDDSLRTSLTSDSSDEDQSDEDDSSDEDSDEESVDGAISGSQCYLGIPTPSDSGMSRFLHHSLLKSFGFYD